MNFLKYGSFEIQSQAMINVLQTLEMNRDKRYFIVVGEAGSGKTTSLVKALDHLARSFAAELKESGVSAIAIDPTRVD